MSKSQSQTETDESEEDAKLRRWRFSQLVRIGISYTDASYLADARIDWHDVSDLLLKGCPPERVPEILL